MTIRCLLADDHPALLSAVGDYLAGHGYEIVGTAQDGRKTIALAESARPDLAVIDYRMPGLGGRELVARLKAAAPAARIVVYTAEAEELLVQDALAVGADAIVLKEAPLEDLVRAADSVAAGRRYVDPAFAAGALGNDRSAPLLIDRERATLARLAEGRGHEEIASILGIGIETVRTHLRKASEKLGAATRTQAVATAIRHGLI